MASKQFDYLQESSLRRLQALIPPDCPLTVHRLPAGGFRAMTLDERDRLSGRYQVVAAWVAGYVVAWQRVTRPAEASRREAEQPR